MIADDHSSSFHINTVTYSYFDVIQIDIRTMMSSANTTIII